MPEDQILQCLDCQQDFAFSAQEQEFFAEKGFSPPKRCRDCRNARRDRRNSGDGSSRPQGGGGGGRDRGPRQPREMHDAVCAECGIDTQVPFKPREDKPVFCRDCFRNPR